MRFSLQYKCLSFAHSGPLLCFQTGNQYIVRTIRSFIGPSSEKKIENYLLLLGEKNLLGEILKTLLNMRGKLHVNTHILKSNNVE